MPTLYIRGKKYSGSTWYSMKVATEIENSAGSIPNSIVTYKLKNEIDEKIQSYDTFTAFPKTGAANTLYMDLETNKTYRWDEKSSTYFPVGTDYNDIDIINGGF